MRNEELERTIVKAFWQKNRVERALFELADPEKRRDHLFSKLEKNVDMRFARVISQSVPTARVIYDILREHGAPDGECYIMSMVESDGKFMPLMAGVNAVVFGGEALISCIHGKLAYLEGHIGVAAPTRYLLIRP